GWTRCESGVVRGSERRAGGRKIRFLLAGGRSGGVSGGAGAQRITATGSLRTLPVSSLKTANTTITHRATECVATEKRKDVPRRSPAPVLRFAVIVSNISESRPCAQPESRRAGGKR